MANHTLNGATAEELPALLFGETGAEMQETGRPPMSEFALELLALMQREPRASWTRLAKNLGVSPTTVARSWHDLERSGLAWVTSYPMRQTKIVGYLWVATRPGALESTVLWLAARAEVFLLERVDGEYGLFAGVAGSSPQQLERVLTAVDTLAGVESCRFQFCRVALHDGTRWVPDFAQRGATSGGPVWQAQGESEVAAATTTVAALRVYQALVINGRASYTDLARVSGASERTVRRRLPGLFVNQSLVTRFDVSRVAVGLPLGLVVRMTQPANWAEFVKRVGSLSTTRLVAVVSGSAPILLQCWVRSLAHADELLHRLEAFDPLATIVDTAVSFRSYKRFGRIIGPSGLVTGFAPNSIEQLRDAAQPPSALNS